MTEVHFIERINKVRKVVGSPGEWESGNWVVATGTAEELVGGTIYLHSAQDALSHFGGTILAFRVVPDDEVDAGRIVFRFKAMREQIGVKSTGGWGMEKKLVGIGGAAAEVQPDSGPIDAEAFRHYFYAQFPGHLSSITFKAPSSTVQELYDLQGTVFFGGAEWKSAATDLGKIPAPYRKAFVLCLFMITVTDQAIFTYEPEHYAAWRAKTHFPKFGWTGFGPHFEEPGYIGWAPERDRLIDAAEAALLVSDFTAFFVSELGKMLGDYGLPIMKAELLASILQDDALSFEEGQIVPAFRTALLEHFRNGNPE